MDEETRFEKCMEEINEVIVKHYPTSVPVEEYQGALGALGQEIEAMRGASKGDG